MSQTAMAPTKKLMVSGMAENLIGSEIIKLAAEVNDRIKNGERIYNFTIGDFDPQIFPIPDLLEEEIIKAYRKRETNYPAANGIEKLRHAVKSFVLKNQGLEYENDEYLIAAGARPVIYAIYTTLLDRGDKVIYPIPSWNNNHYTHLAQGRGVFTEASPQNNFMPLASELRHSIHDATLLALCSPLNPTGTVFTKQGLEEICDLVIHENKRRGTHQKPLYILYDQIYCMLTHGNTKHYDPVSLRPGLKNYVIYVDGISKSFAATGVRVGWAMGPQLVINKMRSILSHIGAWAPKPEQLATANFLQDDRAVNGYLDNYKYQINHRLDGFYAGFRRLQSKGYPVECIAPQAAIYLTVKIDLRGYVKPDGTKIFDMNDVMNYLLDVAKIALVPFYAFGSDKESPWFRLSVGTCKIEDVQRSIESLERALEMLK